MEQEKLNKIIEQHGLWLDSNYKEGKRADLKDADLKDADLKDANLTNANLKDADLRYANLTNADLTNADLTIADLRYANLTNADLTNADLTNADLKDANLTNADLDFSCLPLWCGSSNIIIDERLAKQIGAHAFNLILKYFPGGINEKQKDWLNDFHRIQSNEFPKFE